MGIGRLQIRGVMVGAAVVSTVLWQRHLREAQRRADEAERTRDEAAQRRAMEERLRIARDLHDSLTQAISVIRIQSGVAVHLARKRGEEVPPALTAIEKASIDAARELRTTLSVLRNAEGDNGYGLDQLDALVAQTRAGGLPVSVSVSGSERPLPSPVDRSAYRVIQEALTNVGRHAGQATATVQLRYESDAVTVQVDDDGCGSAGAPEAGSGLGLVGMRERVIGLGGTLETGPRDDGGFRIIARLPVCRTA